MYLRRLVYPRQPIIEPPNLQAAKPQKLTPSARKSHPGPCTSYALNTAKSHNQAWKSTLICGTDWHASSTMTAPGFARTLWSTGATSVIAPVTLRYA